MSLKTSEGEWTIREQLILASAVQRSGDQNWVSVSRAVKPLVDTESRPPDYFSQKSCAQQYSAMLDKAGTHKRKRSIEGTSEAAETAGQQIVRELTEKYVDYLNQTLAKTKDEYMSLKNEIEKIESGELDPKLPEMWEEIQKEAKTKSPVPASSLGKGLHQEHVKQKKKSPSSQHTQPKVPSGEPPTPASDMGVKEEVKEGVKESPAVDVEKDSVPAPPKDPTPPAKSPTVPALTPITPAKPIVTPAKSLVAPDKGTPPAKPPVEDSATKKTKLEVEGAATTTTTRVSVSEAPPIMGPRAFITSGLELTSKAPMTVTIKKEPPVAATPSPMELDSPVPRALTALSSPTGSSGSPREEKYALPMHTPHPSPHGGQVTGGEVHVIVQQPNIAALLVEESAKRVSLSSSAPSLGSGLPPEPLKQPPPTPPSAVVVSSTVGGLAAAGLVQPVRTSSATVSVFKPQAPPTLPLNVGVKRPLTMPIAHSISAPALVQGRPHVLVGVEPKQVVVKSEGVSRLPVRTVPSPVATQVAVSLLPAQPTSLTSPLVTVSTVPLVPPPPRPAAPPTVHPHSKPAIIQAHFRPAVAPTLPATVQVTKQSTLMGPGKLVEHTRMSPSVESLLLQHSPTLKHSLKPAATELLKSALKQHHQHTQQQQQQQAQQQQHQQQAAQQQAQQQQPSVSEQMKSPLKNQPPLISGEERLKLALKQPPREAAAPAFRPAPKQAPSEPARPVLNPPPQRHVPKQPQAPVKHVLNPCPHVLKQPQVAVKPILKQQAPEPSKIAQRQPASQAAKPEAKPVVPISTEPVSTAPSQPAVTVTSAPPVPAIKHQVLTSQPSDPRTKPAPVSAAPPPPPVTATVVAPPPATPSPTSPLLPTQPPPPPPPVSSATPTSVAPPPTTLPGPKGKGEVVTPPMTPQQLTSVKKEPAPAPPPLSTAAPTHTPTTPPLDSKPMEIRVSASSVTVTPPSPSLTTPSSVSTCPDSKLTTPSSSEVTESKTTSPVAKGAESGGKEEEGEEMDDETPVKPPPKVLKSSLKKQWNTRSRIKRKVPFDEGHSVESTDTEDDNLSSQASTVCSPAPSQSNEPDQESVQAHKTWKKAIIIVWRHAAQHKYANLFLHPVREEDAPGYKNVVLRPMDLSTIKKKIESGLIKTDIEFQRDMLLMFQNAFMYNNAEHEVYSMAQEMKNDVMENIQAYLSTQAQLQLMEDATPSKTLRSRESRLKDQHEESLCSPAKKRRTRADDS